MVNKYIWELYLKAGGNETVEFFRRNLLEELTDQYAGKIADMQRVYCACTSVSEDTKQSLQLLYDDETARQPDISNGAKESDEVIGSAETSSEGIDIIYQHWYQHCLSEAEGNAKELFLWFCLNLSDLSTAFTLDYPELFAPYYFFANYNVFSAIADVFDIHLPPIPKKSDYKARTWHYANICKALQDFREENGMSLPELCAFLYDFAPQYIGGTSSYIIEDLPEPRSAYFIGGAGNNSDAVAEDDPDMVSFWQCNPGTRAGDMIVMYLRAPISAVSSIWRSQSVGFIDPFFFYYRCTYIGKPVKIKRMSIKELKADPVLGKMPIVLQNMQGINGIELKPSEFNRMIDLTEGTVPRLEYVLESTDDSFENEKAVEEKLIKPLIKRLGYSEDDYVQQLYIEIGNHNHALIPDFVLYPSSSQGHYSGFTVIEAKRSITGKKQLEETKTQVRSYAKLLGVSYAAVASKEKVWVMSVKDDYSEAIFEASWDELADADVFYSLNRLIGSRDTK